MLITSMSSSGVGRDSPRNKPYSNAMAGPLMKLRRSAWSGWGCSMPRPKFSPTEEQRKLVKSFAAVGISQEEIAKHIGIRSPKTLRKHFREELDRGGTEANYKVAQMCFKM